MSRPTILDPRFRYVPSLDTDVAATWQRFGFSPKDNEARRAGLRARGAAPARIADHSSLHSKVLIAAVAR